MTKDLTTKISPSNKAINFITENSNKTALHDSLQSYVLQNNHKTTTNVQITMQNNSIKNDFQYESNPTRPLTITEDRINLKSCTQQIPYRPNPIDFDELKYYWQKGIDKAETNEAATNSNSVQSLDKQFSKTKELILVEDEDCFRIMKSDQHKSQGIYGEANKQGQYFRSKTIKSGFRRINEHKKESYFKINEIKTMKLPKPIGHSITKLELNNSSDFQNPNGGNDRLMHSHVPAKYLAPSDVLSDSKLISKPNQNETKRINLKDRVENNNKYDKPIPNFTKEGDIEVCPQSNSDINADHSKKSEEAYEEFIAEIKRILVQQNLETQKEGNLINSDKQNEIHVEIVNLPDLSPTRDNPGLKSLEIEENEEAQQRISSKSYKTIIKPDKTYTKNSLERHHSLVARKFRSTNLEFNRNSNLELLRGEKYKNYPCKIYDSKKLRNTSTGKRNTSPQAGLNCVNGSINERSTQEVNAAVNTYYYTYYNPEWYPYQLYQHWPVYNMGFDNFLSYNLHVQNWISLLDQAYSNTMETTVGTVGSGGGTGPLPPLYTGVAGYNWPTIRKEIRNNEPEENNYPVYVKPPVLGNEETEKIRTAFQKYVKWIQYKMYQKIVRKRKQMIRRERNHQSRIMSKFAQTNERDTQDEKGVMKMSSFRDTQEGLDFPLKVCNADDNIGPTSPPHLEADSLICHTITGSESADLPPTKKNYDFSEKQQSTNKVFKSETYSSEICTSKEHKGTGYSPRMSQNEFYIHPICGPVCKRKGVFMDQFV